MLSVADVQYSEGNQPQFEDLPQGREGSDLGIVDKTWVCVNLHETSR